MKKFTFPDRRKPFLLTSPFPQNKSVLDRRHRAVVRGLDDLLETVGLKAAREGERSMKQRSRFGVP